MKCLTFLGAKAAAVIDILSHLLPSNHRIPITVKVNRKTVVKRRKVTFEECKRSIILYVANPAEVKEKLKEREEKLRKENLTAQPIIIYQGSRDKNPEAVYVAYVDIIYTFQNFLEALDIAFKLHFALNLKFSIESEQIWLLLQKVIYEISFPPSTELSNVLEELLPKFEEEKK